MLAGLDAETPEIMRMRLSLHSALTDMARSDQESTKQDIARIKDRYAPLIAAQEPDPEPAGLTVSQAAEQWLADTKPASARRYGMVLRRFKELIGDLPLTTVDMHTIWRFRDLIKDMPSATGLPAAIRSASVQVQLDWRSVKNAHLKQDEQRQPSILPGAMENHIAVLRSLFAWCLKRKFVTANPVVDIDVPDDPRGRDAHHHPTLPYEELPAFMEALDITKRPAATALKFTILTCARTEEVLRADEIRNSVLWWAIALDQAGIRGSGLTFSNPKSLSGKNPRLLNGLSRMSGPIPAIFMIQSASFLADHPDNPLKLRPFFPDGL